MWRSLSKTTELVCNLEEVHLASISGVTICNQCTRLPWYSKARCMCKAAVFERNWPGKFLLLWLNFYSEVWVFFKRQYTTETFKNSPLHLTLLTYDFSFLPLNTSIYCLSPTQLVHWPQLSWTIDYSISALTARAAYTVCYTLTEEVFIFWCVYYQNSQ